MSKGWGRPFEDPIEVAGTKLVTLLDAGNQPVGDSTVSLLENHRSIRHM
ncbi:hypothetical protein [Bradyrhizobium sp. URHA0013]|nr:hypothetical protein [Bradyrhizobium sp. URHA0013]